MASALILGDISAAASLPVCKACQPLQEDFRPETGLKKTLRWQPHFLQ